MKPKIYVAIALILSILVAGVILLLGLSNKSLLPAYLLLFILTIFAISVIILRDMMQNKLVIASIVLVLIAISATFYLTNLRTYHDIVKEYGNSANSPEITLMQSENDYYSAYADYLNQMITQYQDQNKMLETKLAELEKLKLAQIQAQQQQMATPVIEPITEIIPPETSYITYVYPDNEMEGSYDD
jgi:hypothetical protein